KERECKPKAGLLDGIPAALPALTRALKLQAKAARAGFDWPSVKNGYENSAEEVPEFRAAPDESYPEEFCDLLFAMANVARHLGIDPEAALRSTNAKFERRFAHIEARLADAGRSPAESNLDEMDALWNEAKSLGK